MRVIKKKFKHVNNLRKVFFLQSWCNLHQFENKNIMFFSDGVWLIGSFAFIGSCAFLTSKLMNSFLHVDEFGAIPVVMLSFIVAIGAYYATDRCFSALGTN